MTYRFAQSRNSRDTGKGGHRTRRIYLLVYVHQKTPLDRTCPSFSSILCIFVIEASHFRDRKHSRTSGGLLNHVLIALFCLSEGITEIRA